MKYWGSLVNQNNEKEWIQVSVCDRIFQTACSPSPHVTHLCLSIACHIPREAELEMLPLFRPASLTEILVYPDVWSLYKKITLPSPIDRNPDHHQSTFFGAYTSMQRGCREPSWRATNLKDWCASLMSPGSRLIRVNICLPNQDILPLLNSLSIWFFWRHLVFISSLSFIYANWMKMLVVFQCKYLLREINQGVLVV